MFLAVEDEANQEACKMEKAILFTKKKMLACLLMDVVRRMDRVSVRKMEKR